MSAKSPPKRNKKTIIDGRLLLFKLFGTAVRVVLRGRAHLEWKVVVSGDQQSISDDQYFIDERSTIWGKGKRYILRIINELHDADLTVIPIQRNKNLCFV